MDDSDLDLYRSLSNINLAESHLLEYYIPEEQPRAMTQHRREANKVEYIMLLYDMKITASIQVLLAASSKASARSETRVYLRCQVELLITGLLKVDLSGSSNNIVES